MYKLSLLLLFALVVQLANAQSHFKTSITTGVGIDPNTNTDSLFFSKNYNAINFRLGYHYGKLGLILNTTYILQNDLKDVIAPDARIPLFVQQAPRVFSNVKTLNTTMGIELCVPIIKRRAQLNFYATYGISSSRSDSVAFYDVNLPAYAHIVRRKMVGCMQSGFSFNYKLSNHLAIKQQNELNLYSLPYNAVDTRKSPIQFLGSQSKTIVISSLGVQYTL